MSYILVVGSAHIDAVAITDEPLTDGRPDVEGRVSFSLGGTAFNIAKNLAQHGRRVEFLTSLKRNSITAGSVEIHCQKFGIKLRPIYQNESEGGFAGHFLGTRVVKAVCEAAIERVTARQFEETLIRTLPRASLVVVDTNVHSDQLYEVLRQAVKHGKDVIVAGVSVSRVRRLHRAVSSVSGRSAPLIGALCVNIEEAKVLGIIRADQVEFLQSPRESIDVVVLSALRVRYLVLSCGAAGYCIVELKERGEIDVKHGAVNINPADVKSDNGAGDAMVAAIASEYTNNHKMWQDRIQEFVAPVLKVVSATTGDELKMSETMGGHGAPWVSLAVSVFAVVLLPIVGRLSPMFFGITADDVVFLLAVLLGLAAGIAGGKLRDIAAQIGLTDQGTLVSSETSILSAVAGLISLFSFFVLPRFVDRVPAQEMHAPTHFAAALWFLVALTGGYFTDLVARQRLQLKQLKEMVETRE